MGIPPKNSRIGFFYKLLGGNTSGQLGDGTTMVRLEPTRIGIDTNWASISTNFSHHTVAIRTDGSLWAWGNNGSGQLGDGTTTQRNSPVRVPGL